MVKIQEKVDSDPQILKVAKDIITGQDKSKTKKNGDFMRRDNRSELEKLEKLSLESRNRD